MATSTTSTAISAVQLVTSANNSTGNNALTSDAKENPLAGGEQVPSEFCSICGSSDGQLIQSEPVTYDGNEISCKEFGWIFLSKNIAEGSDKCLDIRAQHGGTCCKSKSSGDGCDLCNTVVDRPWNDVQLNKSVQFEGEDISCVDLSDNIRVRFELASEQCLDSAEQYFGDCW